MPAHDIIDNRNEKLAENINTILDSTEAARFAVGYFFLCGFECIADKLEGVKELRLLIGNTTNQRTLEQMAEGYQRLELVSEALEAQSYPKRIEVRNMVASTGENVRKSMEWMDQTDEGEALIRTLAQMIEEKRVKVRVYTKGPMHAKAYIFDYGPVYDEGGRPVDRHEKGIAIVGSSNLSLSGVTHNTELNVVVQGNDNHAELVRWFEELWEEAGDFDEALMHEMQQSWAMAPVRPYDIYMKTLYQLVKDRLEGEEDTDVLWDDEITRKLADFQKVAVRQAVQMIRKYRGAFVADVVGTGKSFVGAAIVKHFERIEGTRPIIICPKALEEMWEMYNEVYELNARVVSMGLLREDEERSPNFLLDEMRYRDRDFVLVDESHNFRYPERQRYKVLQSFLATGRRCCFLTATPRNKTAWDVYHQIKLFHQNDITDLPIDPPNLREYFRLIEQNGRKLPDLLSHVLIRRTRNHILRWYGYDAETHDKVDPTRFDEYKTGRRRAYIVVGDRHQFFPKRELDTIEYSIEDTYQGLYQQIRGYLGKAHRGRPREPSKNEFTYARYGLWHYVDKQKQRQEPYASLQHAGVNLCGLMRTLLFKRFESSVHAFRETMKRLLQMHQLFVGALEEGIVPAGEEAQTVLYESDLNEERDLLDTLRGVSDRYDAADFDVEGLRGHIGHDIHLLQEILTLVDPISSEQDAKLQTLKRRLVVPPLNEGKCLIFTQYADTAQYLYDNLNPDGSRDDIEVIYSGDKSKARMAARFAPKANPEYRLRAGESEVSLLVATDVLAEGLNLQDGDKIINYDLHWNPVRLIQRFGRIDRIGSEHEIIYGFNFLPETGIERNLGLREKLRNRIREIHDTIGEDAAILDPSEQLNEEAMYAIYEKKGEQLSLFEEHDDELVDINEAEEILRQLRTENPTEYERIADLRDGIRTARVTGSQGLYVFCQAGRYQQLFLLDDKGEVVSRDVSRILGAIRCDADESGAPLPRNYNSAVMRVKRQFAEEVKQREAERDHTLSLSQGQWYVIRELGGLFSTTADDDMKGQINILEKAFRRSLSTAIKGEVNRLRRNGVTGHELFRALGRIYHQHRMGERVDQPTGELAEVPVPWIVCSEALI